MTYFSLLIFTAIAVSIDSFVVGFGVCLDKKSDLSLPAIVAIATLLLCGISTIVGAVLQKYLNNYVDQLSALLLFCLGVGNLNKSDEFCTLQSLTTKECWAIGFTVGLDGAVANLSLALHNFGLLAPMTITIGHFVAVLLGQKLASKVQIEQANRLSAFTLIALALFKLVG